MPLFGEGCGVFRFALKHHMNGGPIRAGFRGNVAGRKLPEEISERFAIVNRGRFKQPRGIKENNHSRAGVLRNPRQLTQTIVARIPILTEVKRELQRGGKFIKKRCLGGRLCAAHEADGGTLRFQAA